MRARTAGAIFERQGWALGLKEACPPGSRSRAEGGLDSESFRRRCHRAGDGHRHISSALSAFLKRTLK